MTLRDVLSTHAPAATVLIRLMVGAVFLSEGIQKFLYPASRGTGRFEKMGFSNPEFWATVVGVVEVDASGFPVPADRRGGHVVGGRVDHSATVGWRVPRIPAHESRL
jgi:hypothetical protein